VLDAYETGAYGEHNPDWHEADAPFKAAALAVVARFAGLVPHTVLDVGCGTGRVLAELKRELDGEWPDTTYEGWDIASEPIGRARASYEGDRITFVKGDFLESERKADLLLCVDVIEHVASDLQFLVALRPRAQWFLFRIPLDLSALDVVRPRRLLEARRRYGHRQFYTRETALALLEEAGFQVEVWRYDRVPPPADTLRRRLVDRVRRSLFSAVPDATVRWIGGFSLVVCARPRLGPLEGSSDPSGRVATSVE
jgi:SAM-dependent methyltransferase